MHFLSKLSWVILLPIYFKANHIINCYHHRKVGLDLKKNSLGFVQKLVPLKFDHIDQLLNVII